MRIKLTVNFNEKFVDVRAAKMRRQMQRRIALKIEYIFNYYVDQCCARMSKRNFRIVN